MAILGTNFPYTIPPISNISPFTYRDGGTYLEVLYALRDYINNNLRVEFNEVMVATVTDFNNALELANTEITDKVVEWETQYAAFIANFVDELALLNASAVAGMVTAPSNAVNDAVMALIDAEIVSAQAAATAYTDATAVTLRAEADTDAATAAAATAAAVTNAAAALAVTDATVAAAAAAATNNGYLVGAFLANGVAGEKLSTFYSPDGKTVFGGDNNPAYVPVDGQGVRDPSLLRHQGKWYVTHTSNNGVDKDIQIAVSDTGAPGTWALLTVISGAPVVGMVKMWAPEFVVDGADTYIFFSSIDAADHGTMYWIKATNSALTAWTAPVLMTVTDAPIHYIDGSFVKTPAGGWAMFYSTGTNIERATASTITGTYVVDRTGNWAGWGTGIEGPEVLNDNGVYRIYFDRYVAGTGYAWSESADLATWSTPVSLALAPGLLKPGQTIRHGSFVKLTERVTANTALAVQGMPRRGGHAEYTNGAGVVALKNTVTLVTDLVVDTNETTDTGLVSWDNTAKTLTLNRAGIYAITCTSGVSDVTGVNRTFMELTNADSTTTHLRASGGAEDSFSLSIANFKNTGAGEAVRLRLFGNWTGGEASGHFPIRVRITLLQTH